MQFMKRRSHDPTDRLSVDSSAGALIEKWIVPDDPHVDGEKWEYVDKLIFNPNKSIACGGNVVHEMLSLMYSWK